MKAKTARVARDRFLVVAIGASAGGLESFESFFRRLPADTGMAFILVPHLEPTHHSLLPEILQRATRMTVSQAKDRVRVEPNRVYIIPPNRNMEIFGGVLRLSEMKKNVMKSPISHFFTSLAKDQKERAVAVVLSGMGSDGALGAENIRNAGGLVIAEDPSEAKYDAMPNSVIKTGVVDFVLPVERIPAQIIHYVYHILPERSKQQAEPEALQKIFSALRRGTGHDFSSYKRNTILRRIERRMNALKLEKLKDYARYLEQHHAEVAVLFKDMLIGVTNFFRDTDAFTAIRAKLLPLLFDKKTKDHSFRVWVPACSTGEEAYSLAILLKEYMREIKHEFTVQIFATDIDEEAIDFSRQGVYPEAIAEDVPKELLRHYFVRKGSYYQIDKSIREMIIFAPQNLIKDPPFLRLDLVSCRNLLIYLDAELQNKLLPMFHYVLKPGGFLILGPSESIGGFMDLFSPVDNRWKIYRRKDVAFLPQPVLNFPFSRMQRYEAHGEARIKGVKTPALEAVIDRFLIENYAPKSLVVNEKGDILYFHGRTGKFLEPAPGNAKMNVFDMAREGLKLPLETLIRRAAHTKKEVVQKDLVVKTDGGMTSVNVMVSPFVDSELQGLFLVLFEEPLFPAEEEPSRKEGKTVPSTGTKREQELARELANIKSRLQSTVEEMEASTEELKSANEEYQSTNEELKSANEELETSREEMQSLNEELVTVNAELQGKVDELAGSHKEMKDFLDNLEIPIIVLDSDGRIVRFTSYAKRIVNLIETDIGRPLAHISSNLQVPGLVDQAHEVIRSARSKETEVQTKDGAWYLMRILPYRTDRDSIDGVVLIFVEITKIKSLDRQLGEERRRLKK